MQRYEYKVVPAPVQGEKARGIKSAEDRFALALAHTINALAREGWDYVRCDTLPTEERTGLTKRRTVYVNLLIFRRPTADADDGPAPHVLVAEKPLTGIRGLTRRLTGPAAAPVAAPAGPRITPIAEGPAPKLGPATDRPGDEP